MLDSNGEARFVKRLYIADNAALANGLGGPNPTLTSQALATRTAEKIFQTYFGGDAWVGRETPISSIDDRVTSAVLGSGSDTGNGAGDRAGSNGLPATGGHSRMAVAGAAALATAAAITLGRRQVGHSHPPSDDTTD